MTKWSAADLAACDDLAQIMRDQGGAVSLAQLAGHGWTESAAVAQVSAGRWQRPYDGVFVTHTGPLPDDARRWSALLACGPGAALALASAAEADGLLDGRAHPIRIAVPWERRVDPKPGVRVIRRRGLDRLRHPSARPPRTRVEETVLDLVNAARTPVQVIDIVSTACQRRLTTASRIRTAARQRKRLRWRALLRDLLADVVEGAQTPLELAYLRGVERAHGLPVGSRQAESRGRRGGLWRDVHYRPQQLVVELDGGAAHPPQERERDFVRDNDALVDDGIATLRYGWRSVTGETCGVAAQVGHALTNRGWNGVLRSCGMGCRAISMDGLGSL